MNNARPNYLTQARMTRLISAAELFLHFRQTLLAQARLTDSRMQAASSDPDLLLMEWDTFYLMLTRPLFNEGAEAAQIAIESQHFQSRGHYNDRMRLKQARKARRKGAQAISSTYEPYPLVSPSEQPPESLHRSSGGSGGISPPSSPSSLPEMPPDVDPMEDEDIAEWFKNNPDKIPLKPPTG